MLLNNFLHTRSLIKNEQYQRRMTFNTLIPKTTIYIQNPFEKEEHTEEIKKIVIDGGEDLQEEEKIPTPEEKLIKNLEEDNKELEEEVEKCENKIEKMEEEREEKEEKEEREEKEAEEDEWEAVEEEKKDKNIDIDDVKEFIKDKLKGGEESQFQHKDTVFDNLSRDGGKSEDKDIKNVVDAYL